MVTDTLSLSLRLALRVDRAIQRARRILAHYAVPLPYAVVFTEGGHELVGRFPTRNDALLALWAIHKQYQDDAAIYRRGRYVTALCGRCKDCKSITQFLSGWTEEDV
jgi:hypothetical protein